MVYPLVLLHGYGEDQKVWDLVRAAFWPDEHVVTPSYASRSDFRSIEEYGEHVYQELKGMGIDKAILIGHSMGGYIALAIADLHPEFVVGLGLFHSTAYADSEERKEMRLKNVAFLENHGPQAFMENFVKNLYAESFAKEHLGLLVEHIAHSSQFPLPALTAGMKAMRIRPDRRAVLEKAPYPVLFIIGLQDKAVSPDDAREQVGLPAHTQELILPEAGHMGMVEAPEKCIDAIQEYWRRINESF